MNLWMVACLLTWALWLAQLAAIALVYLPRTARFWAWQGYGLGRGDGENGVPYAPSPRAVIAALQTKEGTDDGHR